LHVYDEDSPIGMARRLPERKISARDCTPPKLLGSKAAAENTQKPLGKKQNKEKVRLDARKTMRSPPRQAATEEDWKTNTRSDRRRQDRRKSGRSVDHLESLISRHTDSIVPTITPLAGFLREVDSFAGLGTLPRFSTAAKRGWGRRWAIRR
jgi:gamma-glutamyl phosphate reductase